MNLICNYPQTNINMQPLKAQSFSWKNDCYVNDIKTVKNSCRKKVMAYILAGMTALCGINACSDKKPSGVENLDNIKFEYFNVNPQIKDSVAAPVLRLKSRIPKENNFLDNLEIDVTKDFKSLDDSNSFRKYIKTAGQNTFTKGISFYSDEKLPRRIIIQEKAHKTDKLNNYIQNGEYSEFPALKQTVMHEVGHQFDEYYGHHHDAQFALKWDSLLYTKEIAPETTPYDFDCSTNTDKRINVEYNWNCGLSDKEEFHKAMLEDINNLKNIEKKELPNNLAYYVKKDDINKIWNTKDIKQAEHIRSEVYANLFSYALGENEGDKEKFTKCFSKCYEVVRKDITKFLKIKL